MLHFPVVRFRPPSGPPVTFLSSTGTNPAQFHVGSEVTVVYDPSNPSSARVESFLSDTAFPVFLVVIGLLFAAFGALFLLVAT
jgi:hypothetical protein